MKRFSLLLLVVMSLAVFPVGCKGGDPNEDGDAVIKKNQDNAANPPELTQGEKDVISKGIGAGGGGGGGKMMGGKK